jgi:ATP-dependent DNA ligase
MLAGRWSGVMPDEAGALIERKHDGFRCLFFVGLDGQPGLWTRGGMPMPGASHILARLLEIGAAMGGQWMIDGELVVDGTLAATKAHYERGWRIGDAGVFHAFDALPIGDWTRGRCDIPLFERKAMLARAISATAPDPTAWEWRAGTRGAGHGLDPVDMVTDIWAFTAADVEAEAQRAWAAGHEGVMIKQADAPYLRARSDAWLKLKRAGID